MKKRLLKNLMFVMVMTILCFAVAMTASAVTYSGNCGAQGSNLTWEVNADTATLYIRGSGEMADYTTGSSTPWHEYLNAGFAYVNIDSGVTSIGNNAFRSLKADSITIPYDIEDIGYLAFNRYTTVIIEEEHPNFKKDEDGVIYTKNGETLIYANEDLTADEGEIAAYRIADGVKTIEPYAFADHYTAETLYIPESVTSINKNAFFKSLEITPLIYLVPHFVVDGNNSVYSSDECGILFNKDKTILYSAPYADMFDFTDSLFIEDYYIVPDSVEEIADYAFYGYCSNSHYVINTVYLGENVKKIGNYSFYNRYGENAYLYIPDSVTELGFNFVKMVGESENSSDESYVYYEGTESDWNNIFNKALYEDYANFYFEHIHNNEKLENCTEEIHTCVVCKTVNNIVQLEDGKHIWYEYNSDFYNCKDGGKIYYRCEECGEEKTETIESKEHNWYEADYGLYNCEDGGWIYYNCSDCYESYEESLEPSAHTLEWRSDNNATCTEDGTKTSYCTKCEYEGAFETVIDEGSALGHNFSGEWMIVLPATCYDRGVQIKNCSRCTAITSEVLPLLEHKDSDDDKKCDGCSCSLGNSDTGTETPDTPDEPATDIPEEETNNNPFSGFLDIIMNFIHQIKDFFNNIFK